MNLRTREDTAMLAAGGLLLLMGMGFALSGMVTDGTDDDMSVDGAAPPDDAAEGTAPDGETEATSLADMLFDVEEEGGWLEEEDEEDDIGDPSEDDADSGPGDAILSGEGEEVFTIDAGAGAEGPPPVISDFQSGIDRLILELDGPADAAPEIGFDTEITPGSVLVLADGVGICMLDGTSAVDPADIEIRMSGAAPDASGEPVPLQEDGGDTVQMDGSDGDDTLIGGDGDDTIDGYAGDDLLDGGTGDDLLRGREGMDSLLGGSGNDAITGGPGDDTIIGGPDPDALFGNEGDDLITGDTGADEIYGDEGDDTLEGAGGTDFLFGGDGDDHISGGTQGDLLFGGDGDDFLSGDGGDDFLQGGFGADTLDGGAGDDRLDGTFSAGGATFGPHDEDDGDVLNGGDGDDTIVIGTSDVATGGAGADVFVSGPYIEIAELAGHVTDFDPSQDVIEILFDPDLTPDPVISVEDFADGSGANILFEGQMILSVSGAQGMDPALIELREIDLEPL